MENTKILVSMEGDSLLNIKNILVENGYEVVGLIKDGRDCLSEIKNLKPDIAIMDYYLPEINGYEIAKILGKDKICDIILVINNAHKSLVSNLNTEDMVTVTKPLKIDSFISTVDLVAKNRKKIMMLEKEIESLKSTLDSRKHVEKAKGLLIKNLGITEEQAFRRIQKQSMDRGISMKEIAKAIILTYD